MKSFMTKTLVTGVFLVVPVFFLVYALANSFERLRKIVEPFAAKLNVDSFVGLLVLDALTVAAMAIVVFALGLVAYIPAVSSRVDKIDALLMDYVPGYMVLKGILGGALDQETEMSGFKTVLVQYNGTGQIGFEIERSATRSIVFLPNTPNPRTGTTVVFDHDDVEALDIAPHEALEMLTFFGKGASKIDAARPLPALAA